ncbi:hypothetical protein JTB14_032959 [Gonioctena quinquepunctata]|nr:hypothetical protein JTB14_032959 [Gonioctena quinquepunctata]
MGNKTLATTVMMSKQQADMIKTDHIRIGLVGCELQKDHTGQCSEPDHNSSECINEEHCPHCREPHEMRSMRYTAFKIALNIARQQGRRKLETQRLNVQHQKPESLGTLRSPLNSHRHLTWLATQASMVTRSRW